MAQWFVEQNTSLKPHIVLPLFFFFPFGNPALFLSQNPQDSQHTIIHYFCSPTFKKQAIPYVSLYLDFFSFKGKDALTGKPDQKKLRICLKELPKVQAVIPNSITDLEVAFASQMEIQL